MVINSSRFNFADYISQMLQDYGVEVVKAMTLSIDEVAKESVKRLKDDSPKGNTGKYARGWAVKFERGALRAGATIYGKTGTYQLAHLLEKGHAKRNGQRSRAFVHIAPVEQWAINEVHDRTVRRLEAGIR